MEKLNKDFKELHWEITFWWCDELLWHSTKVYVLQKNSVTCKADEFCCVDFVMGDTELPASERLNPNCELPDTRCMSELPDH